MRNFLLRRKDMVETRPIQQEGKQDHGRQRKQRLCSTDLKILEQSNRDRRRLYTLNLALLLHGRRLETRTSPHTQPLSTDPHGKNAMHSHIDVPPTTPPGLGGGTPTQTSPLGKQATSAHKKVDSTGSCRDIETCR